MKYVNVKFKNRKLKKFEDVVASELNKRMAKDAKFQSGLKLFQRKCAERLLGLK